MNSKQLLVRLSCALSCVLFCCSSPVGDVYPDPTCDDGSTIPVVRCDGIAECADASDEEGCASAELFDVSRVTLGDVFSGYPVVFSVQGVPTNSMALQADGVDVPLRSPGISHMTWLCPEQAADVVEAFVRSDASFGTRTFYVPVAERPSLADLLAETPYSEASGFLDDRAGELADLLVATTGRLADASYVGTLPLLADAAAVSNARLADLIADLLGPDVEAEAAKELLTLQAALVRDAGPGVVAAPDAAQPTIDGAESLSTAALAARATELSASAHLVSALIQSYKNNDQIGESAKQVAISDAVARVLYWVAEHMVHVDDSLRELGETSLVVETNDFREPSELQLTIGDGLLLTAHTVFTLNDEQFRASSEELLVALGLLSLQAQDMFMEDAFMNLNGLELAEWDESVPNISALSVSLPAYPDAVVTVDPAGGALFELTIDSLGSPLEESAPLDVTFTVDGASAVRRAVVSP